MTGGIVVALDAASEPAPEFHAELLGLALRLAGSAGSVRVVTFAPPSGSAGVALAGVERVHLVAADPAAPGSCAVLARAAVALAVSLGATLLITEGSSRGLELAARASVRWNAGLATGAIGLEPAEGGYRVTRLTSSGRARQRLLLPGPRSVVALRPRSFPSDPLGGPSAPVEAMPVPELPESARAGRITGRVANESGGGPPLATASIVVSGGRGLRNAEGFRLAEALAEALGGAVGASRAVTDAGWRPSSYQVGQTGITVTPQLYIALGISGAVQHLAGMMGSRVIVAINSDPQAPIFRTADYGIVGDAFALVPPLVALAKRRRPASA